MDESTRNKALEAIIADLDISPSDFESARSRYKAVATHLEEGVYQSGDHVDIYIQGSFRLGTVIRPYRNKSDADYDIDQVCEINGRRFDAKTLKNDVGNRLKENANYQRMLDQEGRRCWTLLYASQDNRPGFHLDVLPARINATQNRTKIDITHKQGDSYSWKSGDPRGYYYWFKSKNVIRETTMASQRSLIFEKNASLYKSASDVPKQLVRTNLQRAVQLMKRHRDVHFDGKEFKPISIIITTICAHKYSGMGIHETIVGFCDYVLGRLAEQTKFSRVTPDNILDYTNEGWRIPNPADESENFADRWAKDKEPQRAGAFFSWVFALKRSLDAFEYSENYRDLHLATFKGSTSDGQYSQKMIDKFSNNKVSSNGDFLNLIHFAVENKMDWNDVIKIAVKNVDEESEPEHKDIAWVNYYQVKLHSGSKLNEKDKERVLRIQRQRSTDASFMFCCSLLLGEATLKMLRDCISQRGDDVLLWPIMRLVPRQQTELRHYPIV